MTANPNSALDVLTELASIRDYVFETQKQLRAGHMPNMTELEKRTSTLCDIIHQTSSDIQKKCAPELAELVRQLDDCEKDLKTFYDAARASEKK